MYHVHVFVCRLLPQGIIALFEVVCLSTNRQRDRREEHPSILYLLRGLIEILKKWSSFDIMLLRRRVNYRYTVWRSIFSRGCWLLLSQSIESKHRSTRYGVAQTFFFCRDGRDQRWVGGMRLVVSPPSSRIIFVFLAHSEVIWGLAVIFSALKNSRGARAGGGTG